MNRSRKSCRPKVASSSCNRSAGFLVGSCLSTAMISSFFSECSQPISSGDADFVTVRLQFEAA